MVFNNFFWFIVVGLVGAGASGDEMEGNVDARLWKPRELFRLTLAGLNIQRSISKSMELSLP